MPSPKSEQNQALKTTNPSRSYRFEYDTRYHAAKSAPPTLARLSLRGSDLHYEQVEIPQTGTGTRIVRLKGSYTGIDGDLFLRIDGLYAEILMIHHGFQFAIWFGDSENVAAQNAWLTGFLAGDPLSQLHAIPKLENHLSFIQDRGIGPPGKGAALTDLIALLRSRTAKAKREEGPYSNLTALLLQ